MNQMVFQGIRTGSSSKDLSIRCSRDRFKAVQEENNVGIAMPLAPPLFLMVYEFIPPMKMVMNGWWFIIAIPTIREKHAKTRENMREPLNFRF